MPENCASKKTIAQSSRMLTQHPRDAEVLAGPRLLLCVSRVPGRPLTSPASHGTCALHPLCVRRPRPLEIRTLTYAIPNYATGTRGHRGAYDDYSVRMQTLMQPDAPASLSEAAASAGWLHWRAGFPATRLRCLSACASCWRRCPACTRCRARWSAPAASARRPAARTSFTVTCACKAWVGGATR